MRKLVYQAVGYIVWQGAKVVVRTRLGSAPRRIAVGGLFAAVLAALVLVGRKASAD